MENSQQCQAVLKDFVEHSLLAIPSELGRLAYVASLRDAGSEFYRHDGLAALYPDGAVQQALLMCHKELFLRVLESPLERLEIDLQVCLGALSGGFEKSLTEWAEQGTYAHLAPAKLPRYLVELFESDIKILLTLLASERIRIQPAA